MGFAALANAGVFELPQAHYGYAYAAQPEPFDVSIREIDFELITSWHLISNITLRSLKIAIN